MHKNDILEGLAISSKKYGLPPLAGKILGVFYLSTEKYLTFNDLVRETKYSKGAISRTLRILPQINTVPDINSSRRRLFYLDELGVLAYIDMIIQKIKKETQLILECIFNRNDTAPDVIENMLKMVSFNREIIYFLTISCSSFSDS